MSQNIICFLQALFGFTVEPSKKKSDFYYVFQYDDDKELVDVCNLYAC